MTPRDDTPVDLGGAVSAALERALTEAQPATRDRAAVALARRYAALIDEASPMSKYAVPLRELRRAVDVCGDDKGAAAFDKIHDALAAHSVASDLGPKLLAALTALGLTVAGRGAKGGGTGGPVVPDELAKLRSNAQRRRSGGTR